MDAVPENIEQAVASRDTDIYNDNVEQTSENLIERETLNTLSPVILEKQDELTDSLSNGYIVGVPINISKQNLQSKVKKNNIKKPDDILQTIKQYHNVRLDDAKRTLK